jgi:hypothetical protein
MTLTSTLILMQGFLSLLKCEEEKDLTPQGTKIINILWTAQVRGSQASLLQHILSICHTWTKNKKINILFLKKFSTHLLQLFIMKKLFT